MAQDTAKSLRSQVIYSIFVRNYSKEGTFEAVRRDLPRIRALGTDIIWLMPIHPIGKVHRKGSLGSPYAISDFRGVNPEFGTMEDFRRLVEDIHAQGMKCIIDVVYHHTSPDSWLAQHHPEWFFHKADGSLGNQVGDWWDVVDLDYSHEELWAYQIETLCQWAEIVDGFRCDVAPMVPVAFWQKARQAVAAVRPHAIWLAESVEPEFIRANRQQGIYCASDGEVFQAFDLSYEYDTYFWLKGYLTGENSLADYAARLNQQESTYPDNYDKLRFLENHDRLRAHYIIPDAVALQNWTAFLYYQKGTTLIYAGEETGARHTPSLFDKDTVDWKEGGLDLAPLMQRLAAMKKNSLFADSTYEVHALPHDVLLAVHTRNTSSPAAGASAQSPAAAGGSGTEMSASPQQADKAIGLFSLRGASSLVEVGAYLPDGIYTNEVTGRKVEVAMGHISLNGSPIIILN